VTLQRIQQALKHDLIAGLLVAIPLAITGWLSLTIAHWVFDVLTRIPKQINPFNGFDPMLAEGLNFLTGLVVPIAAMLGIGLLARNIVGRWLLETGETLVQAIPLAGLVYKTLKQLLETLLRDTGEKFRRVVLVEYPRSGIWSLAFVTGAMSADIQSHFPSGPMLSLFIPTTPNPTTGWYAVVSETDVVNLSLSIEDAFKIVISGGIVSPDSLPTAPSTSSASSVKPIAQTMMAKPMIGSGSVTAFEPPAFGGPEGARPVTTKTPITTKTPGQDADRPPQTW
jgi:uncharacterized membrane protein